MAIRKNTKSSKPAPARNRKKGAAEAEKKNSKKTPRTKAAPGKLRVWLAAFQERCRNPRLQAAVGVSMLVAGIYMGCALVSGLFTGSADYAIVLEGLNDTAQTDREPYQNWLGGSGAFLAFWFGRQGLGLGALSLPVLFIFWSWPMITQRKSSGNGKTIRWALLWTVISPWFVGYIASILGKWGMPAWDHWIGTAGHFLTENALIYLGTLGNGLVFGGIILAITAYYLQPQLNQLSGFSWASIAQWFSSDDAEASAWNSRNAAEDESDSNADNDEPLNDSEPSDLPWEQEDISTPASSAVMEEPVLLEEDDDTEATLDELLTELEGNTAPETSLVPPVTPAPPKHNKGEKDDDDVAFEVKVASDEAQLSDDEIDQKVQDFGEYDPTLDLSRFEL
ncbi:MAG: DNA translocase FtsK 4TM domain-containing protein, partial [Flavobacteriales bacterium]|nr:DNA translocase FtsK 4TM domain-containing protein [Flavobacteriales bacterium]